MPPGDARPPPRRPLTEWDLIDRVAGAVRGAPGVVGIGDDAAVLADGTLLCTDAVVDGVHVSRTWASGGDIGWKAAAVTLSDVAAMGGAPEAMVVALCAPEDLDVLAVMEGVTACLEGTGCVLVGGDTTISPVAAVVTTATGRAARPLLRSGARPGDAVMVSGPLGGAAAALRALRQGRDPGPGAALLHRPVPRLAAGQAAVVAGARAAIDISDGLVADAGHVARASGVAIDLDSGRIPLGPDATLADALGGGDDYELLVTAPDPGRIREAWEGLGLTPAVIGRVVAGPAAVRLDGAEAPVTGWTHRWGRPR